MDFLPQILLKNYKNTRNFFLHGFCFNSYTKELPMKDLRTLETEELIDMLTKLTERYTYKIAPMNDIERSQCEYDIALIQGELNSRIKTVMPQSETKRIFNKIKSILPLWNRYFDASRLLQCSKRKPGYT